MTLAWLFVDFDGFTFTICQVAQVEPWLWLWPYSMTDNLSTHGHTQQQQQ